MENLIIRKATAEDAEGKGFVHYQSWIETYTGLFPDDFMKKQSLERNITIAREHPENTYIAIVDDEIVGFACYSKSRDDDLTDAGEIMAIYLLEKFQGKGIGKNLALKCIDELSDYQKMSLWVLQSNTKAIRFYEGLGFKEDGKQKVFAERRIIRMTQENKN